MKYPYKYYILDNHLVRELKDLTIQKIKSNVSMNDIVSALNDTDRALWDLRKAFNDENDNLKERLDKIQTIVQERLTKEN